LILQLILGNSTHLEKSEEYRFFKPWLGDGLLISSGQLVGKHCSGGFWNTFGWWTFEIRWWPIMV